MINEVRLPGLCIHEYYDSTITSWLTSRLRGLDHGDALAESSKIHDQQGLG